MPTNVRLLTHIGRRGVRFWWCRSGFYREIIHCVQEYLLRYILESLNAIAEFLVWINIHPVMYEYQLPLTLLVSEKALPRFLQTRSMYWGWAPKCSSSSCTICNKWNGLSHCTPYLLKSLEYWANRCARLYFRLTSLSSSI